jgi:hypothetical protein
MPVIFAPLLSVAARLRLLAANALCQGDQALFLLAAEALEKRADWLAVLMPEGCEEPEDPALHRPVNLIV